MKKLILLLCVPFILGCEEPWDDDDCDQTHQADAGSVDIQAGDRTKIEKVDSEGKPIKIVVGDDSVIGPVNSGPESQNCPTHGVPFETCKDYH